MTAVDDGSADLKNSLLKIAAALGTCVSALDEGKHPNEIESSLHDVAYWAAIGEQECQRMAGYGRETTDQECL